MTRVQRLNVGDRLPDPYFDRVQNRAHAFFRVRACEECGFQWPTSEIVLTKSWEDDIPSYLCPSHPTKPGQVKRQVTPRQAMTGNYGGQGLLRVLSFGGVYRRRECQVPGCKAPEKETRSRWTTAEVATEGVVVADVTVCPRCRRGVGKIQAKRKPLTVWVQAGQNDF